MVEEMEGDGTIELSISHQGRRRQQKLRRLETQIHGKKLGYWKEVLAYVWALKNFRRYYLEGKHIGVLRGYRHSS